MRQFLLGLSFSAVFGIGCAVGTMQGSQVAQAEGQSGHWEFDCVRLEEAQELAAAAWEPYAVTSTANGNLTYCFRRARP